MSDIQEKIILETKNEEKKKKDRMTLKTFFGVLIDKAKNKSTPIKE
jgi:hypothetical protein